VVGSYCRSNGVVNIEVVTERTNGKVTVRPAPVVIEAGVRRYPSMDCGGMTIDGDSVYYTPNTGYTGSDVRLSHKRWIRSG
jgi:hypothetical protein